MNKTNTRLGQILLEKGLLTADQLQIAVNEQMKRRQELGALSATEKTNTSLGEILIEFGYIDRLQLKRGLNWQLFLRKMTIVVSLFAPLMPVSYSEAATSASSTSTPTATFTLNSSAASSKSSGSSKAASSSALDTTAPSMPGSVTAVTVLANKVQISWTAATDNVGVTKYKIFRDNVQIATLLATQYNYVDSKVVAGKSYVYGVAAGDAAGNFSALRTLTVKTPAAQSSASSKAASSASSVKSSASSSEVASSASSSSSSNAAAALASSSSSGVDKTAPSMPASVTVITALTNKVQIGWTAATDNVAVTKYKIYRDQVQIATLLATQSTYTDSKVVAGTSYLYGVSAGDAAGNFSALRTLTVKTPGVQTSASSKAASSASSVKSSASSSKVASSASSSSSSKAAAALASSSSSSGVDKTAPTMPASVTVITALTNKVQIGWTAATDNVAVTKYKVYRDQVQIATLLATQSTYTDSKVVAGKSYLYGVSAGDAAGNFSATKSVLVTTPAGSSASSASSAKSSSPASVSSSSKAASSSSSKAASSSSSKAASATSSASSAAKVLGPWVVNGPVALKWTAPIMRENGTILDITEVGGYELRYRKVGDRAYTYVSINDAWKNYYNIPYLTGTYNFQVAAFDKNGLYSNFVDLAPQ